jgi:putative ATPase
MKALSYSKAYRYSHDESNNYAAGEQYLPDGMVSLNEYQPMPHCL